MITVVYDPERGLVCQDAMVQKWVDNTIICHQAGTDLRVVVGSELTITAIRAAVRRGHISNDQTQFEFEGNTTSVDSNGVVGSLSPGFCCCMTNYLYTLNRSVSRLLTLPRTVFKVYGLDGKYWGSCKTKTDFVQLKGIATEAVSVHGVINDQTVSGEMSVEDVLKLF